MAVCWLQPRKEQCGHVQTRHKKKKDNWPFLEIQEDFAQATSSADHVQVDGSQQGEVDLNDFLRGITKSQCFVKSGVGKIEQYDNAKKLLYLIIL